MSRRRIQTVSRLHEMPFDGATVVLLGDATRRTACDLVMRAPSEWTVRIDPPKRTLQQSSRFWATCSDLSKSDITWSGERCSKPEWHDLLISAWLTTQGKPPRFLLGLEGERVSLVKHTRDMSKEEMASLIDYSTAWAVMRGVELND